MSDDIAIAYDYVENRITQLRQVGYSVVSEIPDPGLMGQGYRKLYGIRNAGNIYLGMILVNDGVSTAVYREAGEARSSAEIDRPELLTDLDAVKKIVS